MTRTAAASVGAEAEIGSIEAGKKADLSFIRLDTPAMRPLINPVSNLVHYGHPGRNLYGDYGVKRSFIL